MSEYGCDCRDEGDCGLPALSLGHQGDRDILVSIASGTEHQVQTVPGSRSCNGGRGERESNTGEKYSTYKHRYSGLPAQD